MAADAHSRPWLGWEVFGSAPCHPEALVLGGGSSRGALKGGPPPEAVMSPHSSFRVTLEAPWCAGSPVAAGSWQGWLAGAWAAADPTSSASTLALRV